jgi:4-azaleucine resistance transporter AzlC
VQTLLMTLMIQARHLFYGIAMLDKFKGLGWKRFYLIFGMCDETFSINCSTEPPEGVDRGWFYFFVTLLNQLYWVSGATIGGLLGSLVSFNTEGLDFVMTAMFVVIFLEQWLKEKKHYTALIGLVASVACLVGFGADSFLVPTMLCILVLLTVFRTPIEKAGGLV